MRYHRHRAVVVLVLVACAACDVFLPDIGGEGEACAGDGDCESGLVCQIGTCVEPPGFGEECDDTYQSKYPVCEDNLYCLDGVCSEAGGEGQPCYHASWAAPCEEGLRCFHNVCTAPLEEEVKQPNADLYWLRCVVGLDWDGYECSSLNSGAEQVTWNDAMEDCPEGYRLPTLEEYQSLMGDCEPQYDSGEYTIGNCDSCENSSVCDKVFTPESSAWAFDNWAQLLCWSSTQHMGYSAPEVGQRVYMNFESGHYGGWDEDVSIGLVVCVREP